MSESSERGRSVDLELRVETVRSAGGISFLYRLHSPSAVTPFFHKEIRGQPLREPDRFRERLFGSLEELRLGFEEDGVSALEPEDAIDELVALGKDLYDQLFPPELRRAYLTFRDTVNTVQIVSDEPWIPWEMVHPSEDASDSFLGNRFELTRWLSGAQPPAKAIQVAGVASISGEMHSGDGLGRAAEGELGRAADEQRLVANLAWPTPVEDLSPDRAGFQELRCLLEEGRIDLLHFAGHGDLGAESREPKVTLVDRPFRPRHLRAFDLEKLRERRPLVFLNACHGGQRAWRLAGLGGWADAWIRDCGCGAFVGPQWEVGEGLAFRFAGLVYQGLGENQSLGKAVQTARRCTAVEFPGNPGWLAYVAYAHPECRLTAGSARVEGTPSSQGEPPEAARERGVDLGSPRRPPESERRPRSRSSETSTVSSGKSETRARTSRPAASRAGSVANHSTHRGESTGMSKRDTVFRGDARVQQGFIGDNFGTVQFGDVTAPEQKLESESKHFFELARRHVDQGAYGDAAEALKRVKNLTGHDNETRFLAALALLANRRPRGISVSEVRAIEGLLSAAVANQGEAHVCLLLAFLQQDYYRAKGMRFKGPSVESLVEMAKARPMTRDHALLLQSHSRIDLFVDDVFGFVA